MKFRFTLNHITEDVVPAFYIKTDGGTGSGLDDANAWSYEHFLAQTLIPGNSYLFKRGESFYGGITINTSGTSIAEITFGAYGTGATPKITGLTTLTGWTDLGGGLYEKTLASPPTNPLNVVIVDGTVIGFGRLPKAGLGEASYYTIDSHTTANTAWTRSHGTLTSSEIAAVPDCVGGEILQRTEGWLLDRATITDQSSTVVIYASHPSPRHPTVSYAPIDGHGFFFQNHVNCCTEFGEWTYNQTTKKITMFFGEDPTTHVVQVSTIDNLITADNKEYINFTDIELNGANECVVFLTNGGGNMDFACAMYNAGTHMIFNRDSTAHDVTVIGCQLGTSLNNAISSMTGPNWTIQNTTIENIGTIQGMGLSGDGQYIGVSALGIGSLAEYNVVRDIGYLGIHFEPEDNITVQFNEIHDYCLVKDDGGGIYTWGAGGVNKIVHKNICYNGIGDSYGLGEDTADIYPQGQIHGIYLDQDSENIEVTDNTSFLNGHSGLLLGNNNKNITITGNTLFDNTITQFKGSGGDDYSAILATNNIYFAKRSGSLCMACMFPLDDIQAMTSNSNKICRPIFEPDAIDSVGYTTAPLEWVTYHDGGIVVTTDPSTKFKSLDVWKTYSGQDAASVKSPVTVALESEIRFEFNPTNAIVNIDLGVTSYVDLDGVAYSDNFNLAPYSSKILLET